MAHSPPVTLLSPHSYGSRVVRYSLRLPARTFNAGFIDRKNLFQKNHGRFFKSRVGIHQHMGRLVFLLFRPGCNGCYDQCTMNPALLPEEQGTTILLQLYVSIQQSGELLLYRSPLFVLILSAVYPFAAGRIADFSGWFCGVIRFFLFRLHFFCFLLTMPRQWSRMVLQK